MAGHFNMVWGAPTPGGDNGDHTRFPAWLRALDIERAGEESIGKAEELVADDRTTCQELADCIRLSAYCTDSPSIAVMCPISCEVSPCGPGAVTLAPVTLIPPGY